MESKQKGDIGEIAFMLRASEEGLKVSTPFGEHAYDFIVDQNSRFIRIQVKSNFAGEVPGRAGFQFVIGRPHQSYEFDDVDYFALYIAPPKIFYLIPSHAICDKKSFRLYPDNDESRFYSFKERWEF